MATYADLAEWAIEVLKADTTVTDRVVAGADGILETGQLNPKALEAAQRARRESGEATKLLDLLAWDRGEESWRDGRAAFLSVFIHDRGSGFTNIRAMRFLVVQAVLDKPVALERDAFINRLSWVGRSGHQWFREFDLDYERLDFVGPLIIEDDVYRS